MSVAPRSIHERVDLLATWRLPGCGERCAPRRHDPADHEAFGREDGYAQAVEDMRPRRVSVGCLTIDVLAQVVLVDDRRIALTGTEYRLLTALAAHVGRLLTHQDLTRMVWGGIRERHGGHNVRVTMARLRAKLGPAAGLIHTEIGRGYVLRHSQRDVFSLLLRGGSA